MTESSPSGPVPGPPRPSPADAPAGEHRFGELDEQPVAEHVAVFEAEHSRLQRELGTIDQL